jgi:ribosome-associated heat shock protein Hsp15
MSTRIDKWLWAARFFKTRTQATRACELNRVQCAHQPVKPSREVHIGDRLQIRTEGAEFEIDVLALSDLRGPASVAQTLYQETETSREVRKKLAEERKAFMHFTPSPQTRPSKRDRRKLNQFRGRP